MRGSNAGIADTFGISRTRTAVLEIADIIFSSLVVSPAVVTYWKSSWTLMDLYVLPEQPVISALISAVFGLCCDLVLCVCQTQLTKFLTPDRGRLFYYVFSRLYTYVAGVACIAAFRGLWNLLNECTEDSAKTLMCTTAAATLSLAALKVLRNISASPFAVCVDSPQNYFDVPTMFKKVGL